MTDRKTFLQQGMWTAAGVSGILAAMRNREKALYNDLGVVNVKSFGAAGDGVTDDRPAIQKAVDSIRDTGGTVYLPRGVYSLSKDPETDAGVIFYSNMKIVGAGKGNTILRWRDDVGTESEYHYVMAGAEGVLQNVTLTGFEVDGNKMARTREIFNAGGEGIEIDGNNIVMYDLYIHDVLGEGIDCDFTDSMFISNVIVENTGGNGIHCSDPSVRNVLISNTFTRNCAHGRKAIGNVRYGGLCLRGSGIYVTNHRSVEDAQIANLEGQGLGPENEIHLHQVTGKSNSDTAEGFRIGMDGKVTLSACRTEFTASSSRAYYTDSFTGQVTLRDCYAEHGAGIPYHLSMEGTLRLDGCTAMICSPDSRSETFHLDVDGRVTLRNCEVESEQSHHTGISVVKATRGISIENCRVVNRKNHDGHALHIHRFEPDDRHPIQISIHGGEYRKARPGISAICIEGAPRSVIQIRDLCGCEGGDEAVIVGYADITAVQELFIANNWMDGTVISLLVDQSVGSGLITGNHCKGVVVVRGGGLTIASNQSRRFQDEGRDNRELNNMER